MYPLKQDFDYPFNQWYVAGWSGEFGEALVERTILGRSLVMYRTSDGRPVVLDNRCAHRRFPLSQSRRVGDSIQCGYHGFTYDCKGKCTHIPSQDSVPPSYGVRAFPTREVWSWVWVWMGDPAACDEALIPDHGPLQVLAPGWEAVVGGHEEMDTRYVFVQDNLLDLTHLSFLHGDTIGSPGVAETPAQIEQAERKLEISRWMKADKVDHLPLAKALGMTGLVDREMVQQFFPPGLHCTGSAFTSAAAGGHQPGHPYGGFRVIHGLTPASPTRTHYFWAFCRNFGLGDHALGERMKAVIYSALLQDKSGIQQCEAMVRLGSLDDEIHAKADAAAIRGRRMIETQIAAERQGTTR
jgi:vanillate O-demethylase monooxygenase subunit